MGIDYYVSPAEELDFPENSFDVITACQCFWYFDHGRTMPGFYRMLRPNGRLLVLYMAWLPFEDRIAGASEELVLRYHPSWSGARERMHPIEIPDCYREKFELISHEEYPLKVHFTRESWNGRVKACRGVGASPVSYTHLVFLARACPDVLSSGCSKKLWTERGTQSGTDKL